MRIFIDGNRTFDLDDPDLASFADLTVGDSADAVAVALAVNGSAFAWKADGVVLDRAEPFPDAGDVALLELVDVSTPADPPIDAEVETVALTEPADPTTPAPAGPDAPLVIDDLDAARDYLHQDPPPDEESVLVYLDDVDDTERSAVAALLLHAEAETAEPRSDLIDALAERAGSDTKTGKREGLMLAPSPWAAAADHFDHRYRRNPVTWAHDRLDTFLWSKQRAVLESVRDHRYTAVPSCHDVGKSFAAGTIAAWWLENHPPGEAFVVSTAPSFAQVRAILWREIGRAHRKGKLRGRINQTEWWIDDEIVGYGRKPSDTDPAAFQGIHARYVLVIIDEACGVPKTIFDAVDSLVTNEYSRVLAIGNPDDPASHFADICKPASGWNVIHIDGYDSPNFTGETIPDHLGPLLLSPVWVDERKDRWGETSPLFIAKVRGRFPEESDDGVVQLSMLSRCRVPKDWAPGQLEPVELGVDVGAGGDFTSIRERHGAKVGRVWRTHSRRPEEVHDVVLAAIIESGATAVKVDAIGIGWMLVGWLNRDRTEGLHGATIHGVNVGEGAYDPTRFVNLRDQIWWEIGRELAQDGAVDLADAEDADDLVAQLIAPHYGIGTGGRIKVEKKAETRKRIGRSPDDADAYLLALFTPKVEVDTVVTAEDLDPSIDDGGISPY